MEFTEKERDMIRKYPFARCFINLIRSRYINYSDKHTPTQVYQSIFRIK